MVKLTKRKGFNFFRSYFDVYNELNDTDKLAFIDALLNRQFLGVKPENLTGMAKFAYISQTNSIDSQVKGFEDKTGIKLRDENTPCQGGGERGKNNPAVQVEEKGEVQVKEENIKGVRYSFDESKETPSNDEIKNIEVRYSEIELLEDWTKCRSHFLKQPTGIKKLNHYEKTYFNNAKKTFTVEEIKEAMKCHFMQQNKTIKSMYLRPSHFLEHIEKYHTASIAKEYQLYGSDKVKTAL